ncbi:MAG: PKD domain-containing protein [Chryseolinea sp.]
MICALNSFAQTQVAKKTPGGRGYLEYLPTGYSSSTELYPCIVFLHGSGERGDGSPSDLEKVKAHGVPKFIKNGATMCFTVNGKTECFIVLSPQQTTNRSGWVGDVVPFVQFALANYRIDPNRVYLTGLSMGGDGTWDASYATANVPNYFAALAPASCKGDYNGSKITAADKISVWAFHGGSDTTVPVSDGKRPINGMNSVGANPFPTFHIYTGTGHNDQTWDKVYDPSHTYHNPNVYEWFLSQKRYTPGLPPTADAGAYKVITLPTNTALLSGTGSDSDGTIASYSWKQSSGPTTATTSALNQSALTVSNCAQGKYTFTLTVTDNDNKTAVDTASVIVTPKIILPPTAGAGVDKLITLPTNTVVLTGSGSDSDGTIASYSWKQSSGPSTATTSALGQPALTVSNCVQGVYTFKLTVTDNDNATAIDSATITVASGVNLPPVVNAGIDKTLSLPNTTTTLNAIASDPDGSIVSYVWTKTWGPAATLTNANTATLSIIGTDAGTYTFKVTVIDDKGLKTSDNINVVIKKAVPIANAGSDQQIVSPISEAILQGIGTDADGTIISYAWTQSSGPAAIIVNPTLPTITVSQLTTTGEYVFLLTVTDNDNQKGLDYVKVIVSKSGTSQTSVARSSSIQSEEVQTQETPSVATALNQNYPNPFSSNTTIPFTLENSQHVVVKVYDFFGAEIQTLVNEKLEAGEHAVTFTPSIPNQFFLIKLVADGKLFSVKATQLQ